MPTIRLDHIKLYYEEYGDGKQAVILLHGFLSSSKMWVAEFIPDLMQRYRVYTIDVRGHGNSRHVTAGCNLQQMAEDVCHFMVMQNIDTCILAGMSMGGAIAIQFAINYPGKIDALILMNPGPGTLFSKGYSWIAPILSFVAQKKWFLKPFFKSVLVKPLPRQKLLQFVDDAALVSKETWLQYLQPDNKIKNFSRLKDLAAPALVIIGKKDKTIPIVFQEKVANTIPTAVKVVMNHEGHAVVIENPQKVISEINAFLENCRQEWENE